MRSRLIKLLVFVLLVVLADKMAGFMLRKLYFNQKSSPDSSLTYSFFQCREDVLIFGNSRAQHHYDTRVFADLLKMPCFNAGIDGGHSILLPRAQIDVILERYSPKIIILEMSPASFDYSAENYERLSVLLPYYQALPKLRPLIFLRGPFERFKLLSAIYPFNSNMINIFRFNLNFANPFARRARRKDFDGYVPIVNKEMEGAIPHLDSRKALPAVVDESVIDGNLLQALKRVIQLCRSKNIRLLLVNSPIFQDSSDDPGPLSSSAMQVLEIIRQGEAEFLDFSREPFFAGRRELFADGSHLNEKGAAIFSRMLAQKIINSLGIPKKIVVSSQEKAKAIGERREVRGKG